MKHVVAEKRGPGRVFLSADSYLDVLKTLLGELPPGARQYASDPEHYDFYSERCVKDLKLASLAASEGNLRARLRFNDLGVAEELAITWVGVIERALGPIVGQSDLSSLGALMLDEVLPASGGDVTHELAFHGGTLTIRCSDVWVDWQPAGSSSFPIARSPS